MPIADYIKAAIIRPLGPRTGQVVSPGHATAGNSGADLLTCDAHFQNLPGVVLATQSA